MEWKQQEALQAKEIQIREREKAAKIDRYMRSAIENKQKKMAYRVKV